MTDFYELFKILLILIKTLMFDLSEFKIKRKLISISIILKFF